MPRVFGSLSQRVGALQQRLFSNSTVDEDEKRKISLMYCITLIGVFFLSMLGLLAFQQGGILLGTIDFLVVLLLSVLLFLSRVQGYLYISIYSGIAIMFCLYLFLFYTGGIAGTAFLWSYTFPLFTFFLLGTKKGFLVSSIYFLCCLAIIFIDLNSSTRNLYDSDLVLRFIPSFVVTILFSLIYEKYRENSQQALTEARNTLEKKVSERTSELRTSEARYRTLYDNSGDGISITDFDGHYLSANKKFCSRLGYSEAEFQSMTMMDIYRERSKKTIDAALQKVLSQGSAQFEAVQVTRLNKDIPVEIRAQHIEFDNQPAILCSCRDISERKTQEKEQNELRSQLYRAQKMEAIGMMASGVAHDLNNILAGVVSYPELLLLRLPPSSELRKPLKAIQESGQRAATVVADLLTVARGAASTREDHDISVLVQEYLDSLESKKLHSLHPGAICTHKLSSEPLIVSCSPTHIKKMLMNLVSNALEAMDGEGNILISTDMLQLRQADISKKGLEKGNYAILTIEDDGPGIAEKDMEHIFEPFYTKKVLGRSGTGLGLAVVWNTVQDHNGKIFVKSSKKGTRFQLCFPISTEKTAIKIMNNTTEELLGNGEHILIVDDESQLQDIASQILTTLGYVVDTVSSGEQAIAFIQRTSVDLIVMDMLMEPGMNGRQTYEEIIKQYPQQKAVIVSGFSESEDVQAVLQLGAGGFIKKPYSFEQLGKVVREVLST